MNLEIFLLLLLLIFFFSNFGDHHLLYIRVKILSCFHLLLNFSFRGSFNSFDYFVVWQEKIVRKEEKIRFNCKCSFLEIYNEQILDLLDPSSSNLQVNMSYTACYRFISSVSLFINDCPGTNQIKFHYQ